MLLFMTQNNSAIQSCLLKKLKIIVLYDHAYCLNLKIIVLYDDAIFKPQNNCTI